MDVTCFGENDGTATVTTTGGTPPVTINWSNGQSGPTATNLTAGTYTATATDALGVMDDIQITIGQPPQLFVTIASETPITCSSPATITVEGQGGNPGYEYLWSTGTVGPTEILDNTFFVNVSVTDANGCVATLELAAQVDIDLPVISATGGNLTCNQPSVSIQASANSPCGIYSYSWTDPSGDMFSTEMSPIVSEPGIYSVVVTDLCNGCTASTTANVTSDMEAPLVSVIGTVDSISCLQPIVEITVTDLPSSSYSWTTTNGIIEFGANEATVGVSAGGSYTVLVTNTENGCTSSLDISVTEIEDPAGMVDSTSMLLCFGESNGYAALSSTGGIQPHVFTWPDGMSVPVRSDLSAGTYLVLLSDANGCVDSIDVTIDQPSALLANIGSTPESSSGADDGVAWVAPSGGTPGYTVLWNTGETSDTIAPLPPGMYTATVTDANGCTNVKTTTVQAFGCALTGVTTAMPATCFGDSTGSAIISWSNENGAVQIEWSTGDTTAQIQNVPAGEYIVVLTDEGNCSFSDTVTIGQPSEIIIQIDSINNTSGPGMDDGGIYISVTGGQPGYTFEWFSGMDLVGTSEDLTDVGAGTYLLVVHDASGCTVKEEEIEVMDPSVLDQPNWAGQIDVFPVPMQENLRIQLPAQGLFTLRLMDSRGMIQQVKSNQSVSTVLSVQDLPEGAYWLIIQDEQGAFPCSASYQIIRFSLR
ncbi:MAG: hypothetical protein IPJ06_10260 [Saprospiraceae bacterium]|nr:hypothetical protein [Saprospiraceae bacterium]